MKLRWTTTAFEDFGRAAGRIAADNPVAARRVAQTIHKGIESLRTMPYRGRAGTVEGTRELVFPPWPYIVVYEVVDDRSKY